MGDFATYTCLICNKKDISYNDLFLHLDTHKEKLYKIYHKPYSKDCTCSHCKTED